MSEMGSTVLRAAFETAVDGMIVIDRAGRVLLYNPACERIFGYAAAEVVGRNVRMLMPAPDRDRHDQYLKNYLDTGEAKIIGIGREVEGRRKDGTVFPMDLSVGDARQGEERFFVGIIRDITTRKLAEQELRQQHAFSTAVLDTVGALVVVVDTQGRITHFNRRCEQVTGYRLEQVLGRPVWDLIPPEDLEGVAEVFGELARGNGVPNHYRNAWLTRDGDRRIIDWSNTVLRDENGAVVSVIGTGIDVTDRLLQERQLGELREQLFQLVRLSVLGEMTSALAHEVNQPLSAAMSYVQAASQLMRLQADPQRAPELLEKAVREIGHAGEVIRGVRQFLRTGDLERRAADLARIVDGTLALTEVLRDQHAVRVIAAIPSGLPQVDVDEVQIQQVLLNLVRNAIEAASGLVQAEVRIEAAADADGLVAVSVIDNGPGLSADIRARLFQPFATTKAGGMGVGLSICRSIVRAHGGSIDVAAVAGKGTAFRFTVPVAEQPDG